MISGMNLCAYCGNNPVMYSDEEGTFWHIAVGAAFGALFNVIAQIANNTLTGKEWNEDLGMALITGAVSGALAATGVGVFGSVALNAGLAMAGNVANQVIDNGGFNGFDVEEMFVEGAIGAVSGLIGGKGLGKTVNFKTLNKNFSKKLFSGSANLAKKGLKYYYSQTKTLYKDKLIKPLIKSSITSFSGHIGSGLFME